MFKIQSGIMILIISWTIPLLGQEEWNLKLDKEGIIIHTRSNELSHFDEFHATTELDQSIHAFIAVLKDIDRIPDWMHSVKYSRLLETSGDSVQIYYTEAKAPFPVKNRDGIYLNRFVWNQENQTLTVDIEILPDYLAIEDDMVRISRGHGFWEARENEEGKLEITFQMQVDPGGSIPVWLANMFVLDTPFNTLSKLKKIIAEEKYRLVEFDFIR